MAASIPFKHLLQLRSDPLDLEALFMGQAGLLAHPLKGSYHNELFQGYTYIKSKYKLSINPAMRLHFADCDLPTFRPYVWLNWLKFTQSQRPYFKL